MDDQLTSQVRPTPWRRRPRRPLPALRDWRIWFLLVFVVGVGFLAGLGVVVSEPAWWARTAGGGVSLLSVAVVVALVLYLRRPVVDDRWDPDAPWVRAARDEWTQQMARQGYVDIPRSAWRILGMLLVLVAVLGTSIAFVLGLTGPFGRVIGAVCLLVFVPLGLLPQLEFSTARGPALHVDDRHLRLARWGGLEIPWSAVLGVGLLGGQGTRNVMVAVAPEFYDAYLAGRPRLLRADERLFRGFGRGPAFPVPPSIAADVFPLTLWLASEVETRNPAVRQNDQPAG